LGAPRRGPAVRRLIKDVLLPVAVAIALAFVIQASVAKPYEIPTESMDPTIEPGDRIIANRVVYRFRDIERGDIIVFDPPPSAQLCGQAGGGDIPFVKRVIGLPGDRVQVTADGTTLVNREPFEVEGPVLSDYPDEGGRGKTWPVVPEGKLLVLGDNREHSCDSHQWQPDPFLPEENVIGQAEVTYWPLDHLGFLN
ncbi:MAG TPA: signal peptidase I, partial [Miltoncostaeaceae bacterium]|nr:signal peptidase I [Miltoncostaeaceae bacterium]